MQKIKEFLKQAKYTWWRFEDRVKGKFNHEDFDIIEDPFWYIDKKKWAHIVMNIRSKGANYYQAEVDQWIDIAIKESMLMGDEGKDQATLEITDGYTIKSVIKMIEVGLGTSALEILNDLDKDLRDLAVKLLTSK